MVDLDPQVIQVAREYFGVAVCENAVGVERFRVYTADAVDFIHESIERFE